MISAYSSLSGKDRRTLPKSKIMVSPLSHANRSFGRSSRAEGFAGSANPEGSSNGVWWDDVLGQAELARDELDTAAEGDIKAESDVSPAIEPSVRPLSVEDELLADLDEALGADCPGPAVQSELESNADDTASDGGSALGPTGTEAAANVSVLDIVSEDQLLLDATPVHCASEAALEFIPGNTDVAKSTEPLEVPETSGLSGLGAPAPVVSQPVAGAPSREPQPVAAPFAGPVVLPFAPPFVGQGGLPFVPVPPPPPVASIEAADISLRNQLIALLSSAGMPALRNVDVFVERGVISIRAVVSNPVLFPAPRTSTFAPAPFPIPTSAGLPVPAPVLHPAAFGPPPGWVVPGMPGLAPMPAPIVAQASADQAAAKPQPPQNEIPVHLPDPSLYQRGDGSDEISPASLDGNTNLDLSAETDEAIRDRIVASLVATSIPALSELQVTVEGQSVTLEGVVTSQYERQMVLQMVKRECDAWHVRNGINVVPPRAIRFSITEFAKDLWSAYRVELSVIACLLIAILSVIVPWPKWAPATTYQVAVSATLGQEPMTGAVISLHPDGWSLPDEAVPTGRVGADGKVVFTTFADRDGVPAGEYSVTASWNKLVTLPGGDSVRGPNVVPAVYGDPATSPLKIKIESSTKELPPLEFPKK